MKFSYTRLKEIAGFTDTPDQLAAFLTMRVFEVEHVEKRGSDWMLDIKILPNRMADASGHVGMAREIAALKNVKLKTKNEKLTEDSRRQATDAIKIKITDPKDCARYSARVMEGIRVGPSPAWMRERLETCGLQSINNVVDAANYVMLETGQPLHVFDMQKLKSKNEKVKSIVVRRARKGEKMAALDEKTYELNPDTLVIADERDPVAIAGIKGGRDSGVSADTTRIVLEGATFDSAVIRRASQTLNLRTDASLRFEHGLDANETPAALDMLAGLIQKIAGGVVFSGMADRYPRTSPQRAILLRPRYTELLIGAKIPASFYRAAFARLGWAAKSKGKDFIVKPPTVRRDIEIEEDVIEEIGRLFDYQNINPRMPEVALRESEKNTELFWEEVVRNTLIGEGFFETELYEFSSAEEHALFGIDPRVAVALENPPNPQMAYMVPVLALRYIISAGQNMRQHDTVKIFGIQKEFRRAEGGGIEETKKLVIVSAAKDARAEHFYALKGVLDGLWERVGIGSSASNGDVVYTEDTSCAFAHPYRAAVVMHNGEKIGALRELHPAIAEKLKVRGQIIFAAIPFAQVTQKASDKAEYRLLGKYPAITRDIAVVVSEDIRTDDILNVIKNAGGTLLADTTPFDYFQDDALATEEKKGLAFHLIFQSPDCTLTDAEVGAVIKKITATLEAQDWEVKK
ncbi:MAG: phenylalanine--tRNA ligase subunit beta [Candidatus Sungbacteria bacterium RIFCSPLOWO2_02_FULL_54_10]|uniref:Phenylalanine--tRNA ligase beta subunit n=2 Tax=Candidatus Sungiibacteriota TaxID=1817917 RepID=A0A1G2L7Q4_9BACT|nr:MAG: phenylalanine--tRNA ligase subunit beta [Candidatus Sungbacteria bacterium RIFCSPHIGHO2_01_FULL_54_26]OHA03736.1 MAG: phenylalanine--tRNA ligase subunit beta [Candidatus Sungbacteria bacterium RIFCSPHIGHO2_02_FULL_53_17]OHA07590.1 MAG: phenylalanine--tRNA ligase subunit beta [Candidatus Sungbacteria bacterium RIFCSPLOWO2_01_FULL_54_21]OHA12426.1 MAG: phenylalanine--tRNA ligase subunit beta [Candidatus Sungbacteria bacterium RIFCSPLOWO2_02_FULL_54_10]